MNHKFVEFIPENIIEGTVYISMEYSTAIHKCCCGCGNEVVTPISPTDWKLTFDGESISLYPSIGNWNFECKSHYFIKNNEIQWAEMWSDKVIQEGRLLDKKAKLEYYNKPKINSPNSAINVKQGKWNFWKWLIGRKPK